ncbi:MAG: hypothetical protein ACJAXS_002922, partial [Colwellia sp.]
MGNIKDVAIPLTQRAKVANAAHCSPIGMARAVPIACDT